jgi:hypothetical protein
MIPIIENAFERNSKLIFNRETHSELPAEAQYRHFFSLNFQNQASLFFAPSMNTNTKKLAAIVIVMAFNIASQRTLVLTRYHLEVISQGNDDSLTFRPLTTLQSKSTTLKPEIIDWDNKIPGLSGTIITPALLCRNFDENPGYEYHNYKDIKEIYHEMDFKKRLTEYIQTFPELQSDETAQLVDFLDNTYRAFIHTCEPLRKLDKELLYNYLNSQVSESKEKTSVKSLKI